MDQDTLTGDEQRVKVAVAKANIAKATCALAIAQAAPVVDDHVESARQAVVVAEARLTLANARLDLTKIRAEQAD